MSLSQAVGAVASEQASVQLLLELVERFLDSAGGDLSEDDMETVRFAARESADPRLSAVATELAFYGVGADIGDAAESYLRSLSEADWEFREDRQRQIFFGEIIKSGVAPESVEKIMLKNIGRDALIRFLAGVPAVVEWLERSSSSLAGGVRLEIAQQARDRIFHGIFILTHDHTSRNYSQFSSLVGYGSMGSAIEEWSYWCQRHIADLADSGVISAQESEALTEFGCWLGAYMARLSSEDQGRIDELWIRSEECRDNRHRLARKLFPLE